MKLLLFIEALTGSLEVASAFKDIIEKMIEDGRDDITDDELAELMATRRALENEVHS